MKKLQILSPSAQLFAGWVGNTRQVAGQRAIQTFAGAEPGYEKLPLGGWQAENMT